MAKHPEVINATPNKSSIQRILKENNLKPHQSRYFLHITDPDFFPKMDNLSTHRGFPFCKVVAELSGVSCPPETELNSLEKRVKWLNSTNKRIVIHFTPYHGSWLNLVEFWFGIMNKKVLNESYGSAEELKEGFDAFLEEWNTLLAHPFRWSYNGEGLQHKAVKRFTIMLNQSARKLEITTLTKQLRLMANLFNHYFDEVPEENWGDFFSTLQHQKEILENSIMNEEGLKKKANAEMALNFLLFVLEDFINQEMLEAA